MGDRPSLCNSRRPDLVEQQKCLSIPLGKLCRSCHTSPSLPRFPCARLLVPVLGTVPAHSPMQLELLSASRYMIPSSPFAYLSSPTFSFRSGSFHSLLSPDQRPTLGLEHILSRCNLPAQRILQHTRHTEHITVARHHVRPPVRAVVPRPAPPNVPLVPLSHSKSLCLFH